MAETEQTSGVAPLPGAAGSDAAPLPGAIGISRLHVYDTETVDGLVGGSPHMHFVCAEGYVVLGGRGSVQTLGARGYEERELEAGKLVWFGPGLIHRLVNDGGLEILTLMQNAGLPEAGDAVFTFPRAVLEDPGRYREAVSLEPRNGERPIERAYARRDLAVEGFVALRAEFEAEGRAALERARGESAALRNLANAARMMEQNPALLQLRLLQQLGAAGGNTIVLGLPSSTTPLPLRPAGDEATELPPQDE
jgi:mannose-6-phosphate isomerase-like protein (cupin superfamily)